MSLVIIHKKLNELNPAKYNPRDITEDAFEGLKESLKKFGMPQPIIFNKKTGNVVGGHQRLKAAGALGWETVPTIEIDISLSEEKALNVTLNNQKISGHFTSGLDALLKEIRIENGDDFFTSLKLGDIEIPPLPEEEQKIENEKADSIPEVAQNELGVQLGDIYQLGEHRLMCGDSTDLQTVEKLMNGEKADMVFTDPPYGIGFKYNSHVDSTGDEYMDFCRDWFEIIKQKSDFIIISTGWAYNSFWYLKEPKDIFYWICKNKRTGGSLSHFRKVEPLFIWGKPTNRYDFDFFEQTHQIEPDLKGKHTCPKPVSLIEAIIYGAKNNGLILDIFCGSGTTIIACEKTNRKCYGMELDPHYCSVIIRRWETFTGKKAVKLG